MIPGPPDHFSWPDPWRPLGEADASNEVLARSLGERTGAFTFEAELQHEACPDHPLHRIECRAVARSREHRDEFIFLTARPDMPVAFVHLTWTAESDPTFPYTVGYPSWEAFRAAWANSGA